MFPKGSPVFIHLRLKAHPMRTTRILIFLLLLTLGNAGQAQNTTRILFIGNSFTYGNNMPQMVKAFADSAHIPVSIAMHAPGGISVGDTAQGTQAHMNNPVLFSLIRSQKWDFAVIQDNQGRFVLDSAVFPNASKVVQGHLNIMDSVKANNSCAKIILFGGWAFKFGLPPYGNTGSEMIQRILRNYCVLNDTMKEVIAPIGEGWIKAISQLPAVNLWDADDAHPSYEGSYLTAAVIFSTIFNQPAKALNYTGPITPGTAYTLRCFGDTAVFSPAFHLKYNLGGVKQVAIQSSGGQMSVPGSYSTYTWYKDGVYTGNGSFLPVQGNGKYSVLLREADGCLVKSCDYTELFTGIAAQKASLSKLIVFPNPVQGRNLRVKSQGAIQSISLLDLAGRSVLEQGPDPGEETVVSLEMLQPGTYILVVKTTSGTVQKKISLCE